MAMAISAFNGADGEKKVVADQNFHHHRGFYPLGDANLSRTFQPLVLGSTDGEQFDAGRACVSGTLQTDMVADSQTIPHLVQMLQSSTVNVCGSLLPSLAQIVGENAQHRDYAIGLGIIPPLLSLVKSDSDVRILRHVSWVFCRLCCHKNPQLPLQTINQIFPALRLLSDSLDEEVLVNTVLALSYLTGSGSAHIQVVIDSGLVPVLISLLSHVDESVQTTTLRAVGNIVSRTDEHTQVVLNHNMLAHFPALLDHRTENIRKEALWVISNISAGAQSQVQAVINAGLLPKLIENMWTGELQTQKEAAWAVRNLTISGNNKNLAKLVKVNAVKPLCSLLVCHDEEVLEIALESIQNMLEHIRYAEQVADYIKVCHGLPLIEYHQKSENSRISDLAHAIVDQLVIQDDAVNAKFCCFRRSSRSRAISC